MPDTLLNPEALRVATTAAHDAVDWQMYDVTKFDLEDSVDVATIAAVSAYLTVAQPVVNSVEELDKLPLGALIVDGDPCVLQMVNKSSVVGSEWAIANEKYLYTTGKITLPATVIYTPEVKP